MPFEVTRVSRVVIRVNFKVRVRLGLRCGYCLIIVLIL